MIIKRRLLSALEQHLTQPEITLLVGPRQAGKTTLLKILQEKLDQQKKPTLFLNYDIEQDQQFFSSQQKLKTKLDLEFGSKKGYVFLDEIQRKKNAGLFLKGLFDQKLGHKFIVSGSGSLELKEKIHESLAGRKQLFHLSTVSFLEFATYKTKYRYQQNKLTEILALDPSLSKQLLLEYLNFGGYPRVITSQTLDQKRAVINEIYSSYLKQDILDLDISKSGAYQDLIELIAHQRGNLTNFNKLASSTGLSQPTVKQYLWYAEKTFILHKTRPFFTNPKKEIVKSPLYYFEDLGLLNFITGQFGHLDLKKNIGAVFENFTWRLLWDLYNQDASQIKFWRTQNQAEVDFVIAGPNQPIAIEAKIVPKIGRSLHSFIEQYQPKTVFVANLNQQKTKPVESTQIKFVPFYEFQDKSFLSKLKT